MKIRTITVREGELLGPIDWSYDFRQHDRTDPEKVERAIECLRKIEEIQKNDPTAEIWITENYQWQHRLICIGMYDGWPFWMPTPYVGYDGTLGGEWTPFYNITSVCVRHHD